MLERIEQKLSELAVSKQRKRTDTYSELVFFNKDLKKWDRALSGILGPPMKSKWKKPDENLTAITRGFGGIRVGQTLYYKEFENCKILAMIWPWKDKTHTTLKLSMIKA
jgi:hypothetical protein